MKKFFLLLIAFLLIFPIAYAVKEIKTVKVFGGYLEVVEPNTLYKKSFNFHSPDGVSQIYYIRARVVADMTTTNTRVWFGLQDYCTPKYYDIPDNVKRYTMEFDCTSNWIGEGTYEVGIQANKEIRNVYMDFEFTYMNNPEVELENIYRIIKSKLKILGTDYLVNSKATAFLQLLQNNNLPINNATCILDIYFPNKTLYLENVPMNFLTDGVYYYDWVTPDVEGVYIMTATCGYEVYWSPEEHADEFAVINGSVSSGSLSDTYSSNDVGQEFVESNDRIAVYYNFTNLDIPSGEVFELDIHLEYQWEHPFWFWWAGAGEPIGVEIYNFSSGEWVNIENISGATEDTMFDHALVDGVTDFINGTNVSIRFRDWIEDADTDYFRIDHLYLIVKTRAETFELLKGAGEAHVYSIPELVNISETVAEINSSLISHNQTVMNKLEEIRSMLESHNTTVTSGIQDILNRLSIHNSTVMNKLYKIQDEIANLSLNTSIIESMNESIMNKLFSIQGDLTSINDTIKAMNQTFLWELKKVNDTIMLKLYSIQDEIANVNETLLNVTLNISSNVLDIIATLNELKSDLESHNTTVMNKLYSIQGDLDTIYDTLQIVKTMVDEHNLTVMVKLNSIHGDLIAHNSTVMNKLYEIENDMDSFYDDLAQSIENLTNITLNVSFRLETHNSTVMSKLEEIKNALESHNSTVMNKLFSIQGDLDTIYNGLQTLDDLIRDHNLTVMIKLESIEGELISHNETIINELYEVRDNITSFYETLANSLANVTNVTLNVSFVLSEVPVDTWKTFLKLGTPPLMPSTEYYCKDNQTLIKNITREFCEDHKCSVFSIVEEIRCEWGCDPVTNSCAPNPFYKWLMVVGIIAGIFLVVIFIWRRVGGYYYR